MPKLIVRGVEYDLVTSDDFTLGEAAEAERIAGQDYDFEKGGAGSLVALAFVSVRRVDERVTVEDILSLKGDEIQVVADTGEPVVPPPSAVDESGSPDVNRTSSTDGFDPTSGSSPEDDPGITGAPA